MRQMMPAALQLLDAGGTVSEPVAVDERVVLADATAPAACMPALGVRERDRHAHADDVGHAAELGCSSGTVSPRASTRGSRTASRGERTSAAGTPCRSSSGTKFGRRKRARERLDVRVHLVDVRDAGVARREARVVLELGVPDGGEDTARELLGRRADRDVAVGRLVDAERRQARHHAAGALRQAARLEQVEGLGRDERRQDAEHRDVHVLAGAGGLALPQRRENADDAEDRREQIRHRHADADRRVAGRARRHHQAAQRLDDGVHRLAGALVACVAPKPEIEQ